ncbi:MAG: pirin family protein [Anaerolineales bacterium]|nr:pirin family protein [Anaerolineales bacterium]
MNKNRTLRENIEPQFVIEGAGVLLRRSFGPQVSNRFDPFLLFDHFAFNDPVEGPIVGFPMHPHRGIETVTYMLEGSVSHRDSLGNAGLIGPGDVQWMTAGGGILHEELPRRGPTGSIYGFQLWVNLPAADKMTSPRYQEILADSIPVVERDGTRVRVVAGEVDGVRGPVSGIAADPLYLEVALAPGTCFLQEVPAGHLAVAYVFEGRAAIEGREVEAVRLAVFDDGDRIDIRTGDSSVRFMLMAGAPFGEPIAPYGPFVMNTRAEIQQALEDLRNGTFVMR